MGSGHEHQQSHDGRARLAVVLALTIGVLLVETVGAFVSGSLALLADAGHMLTDVAGLSLSLVAAMIARREPNDRRTWGYLRAEVLGAALQAAVLLGVGAFILVEGVRRLLHPTEVSPTLMLVFGVVGLVGNLAALAVLLGVRHQSLNLRAAFLEVATDAFGSVAVLLAAAAIALTGWERADAVASLVIGAAILPRTLLLLREAVEVLLESTPRGVDLADVRRRILGVPHVREVHDLHASLIATGIPVLTVHVVVDELCFHDGHLAAMLDEVQGCLSTEFDVAHSTIQFESAAHSEHEHRTHR